MYAALFVRKLAQMRHDAWKAAVRRSGLLITLGIAIVLLLVAFGIKERGHGHLTKLKTELKRPATVSPEPAAARPGGQDAVVLSRAPIPGLEMPEFLSATLLPGRGMNVLQIEAYIPGKGTVNLLASPPVEDAAKLLSGAGEDAEGNASLAMGGAIEAPWAGRVWGTKSQDGTDLTKWRGSSLSLPVNGDEEPETSTTAVSVGGLLLQRKADTVKTVAMPDGGQAQAIYDAGDFDGHWLSHTEITTIVQLSGRALEMNISARNNGNLDEPIGIGWHPRFAILSNDRKQVVLKLPNALHAQVADRHSGMPSGKLVPVQGTPYDFTSGDGKPLGTANLNDSFVQLKPRLMDSGPVIELRDPKSNYGLRITVLSVDIKALRVYAPADANFISLDPQFNYDDPFGKEWGGEDTGMVVLPPGHTAQWKIRLEIFSLNSNSSQHLEARRERRFDPPQRSLVQ